MEGYRVMVLLAGAVAVGGAVMLGGAADALASPTAGAWGTATEVPGLATLNAGGRAEVLSVSCGPAGGCAAGGSYEDRHGHLQGYVVSAQNGNWGTAAGVPGLATLNAGGQAEVLSVSCGPAGSCAAGGYYYDRRGHQQGFVVSEKNGTWGKAIEVPGLGDAERGVRRGHVGVVRFGGQLRGRRVLQRPARSAGVRGQRAERRLGQGDRGARPGAR